jgi:hypothetical protein
MRRFLLIAPTLWVSTTVFATSFASFTGGPGDGYSSSSWRTYQPATLPAQGRFAGSGYDGYASSKILSSWSQTNPAQARFAGSGYDGYASSKILSSRLQTNPAQARFAGNGYDGYASSRMLSSWLQTNPAQARFAGNGYDGYASSRFFSVWQQAKPKRFFGGSFDGYDRNASLGIPNWTVGDTDGNGLPDWWELKYFGVLTGTDPNADPDHDGASNLFEYLTGTNPTNANSYFHIVGLTPGSPTKIFVTCEPGKFYTLQRADDLALGWTVVSNQTRISPASEGILEMDDYFSDTGGFYRVRLEH